MRASSLLRASATGLCAIAGQAWGQISPTGPFIGPFTEGFEFTNSGFTTCITARVFNGTADLCTVNAQGLPVTGCNITTGWSFNCQIAPHGGSRFFGSANGAAQYTFDTPVGAFGGYFGTNGNANLASGATITFYDPLENVIGTENIAFPNCGAWEWHGWQSTTPIKKVRVFGNGYGGPFVMMDDMEYRIGGTGPSGACCLVDGSCVVTDETGCTSLNGIFRGVGTTCPANCPQPPTGACCLDVGCAIRTQAQCTAAGGTYRGDNSACATANCPAPTAIAENGDAGELPGTAQVAGGTANAPLTGIHGSVGPNGDADMYKITICDAVAFSASTVGRAQFDTQLFLFDLTGHGVTADDDTTANQQSALTAQFIPGTGDYFIAISGYDSDPLGDTSSGEIWLDTPFNAERRPDGPAAGEGVGSWNHSSSTTGPYTIALTGACFVAAGTPCYPDCDLSHSLNVNDFVCFQQAFAGGNMALADCTRDNTLNVNDFVCFQSAFAAGCSAP